jgi:hypothetical protein
MMATDSQVSQSNIAQAYLSVLSCSPICPARHRGSMLKVGAGNLLQVGTLRDSTPLAAGISQVILPTSCLMA